MFGFLRKKKNSVTVQSNDTCALSGFSKDEISSAALDLIYSYGLSTWGGSLGGTLEKCNRVDEAIEKLRVKFKDYQPRRLRNAVIDWLDYYQDRCDESREDITKGTSCKRMDDYNKYLKNRQDKSGIILSIASKTNAVPQSGDKEG